MNTRRNETIGCNLVNGRGSRDEHGSGRPLLPSYTDEIETYFEWIAAPRNERLPRSIFASFSAVFSWHQAILFALAHTTGCGPRKWNHSKSDYVGHLKRFPSSPCRLAGNRAFYQRDKQLWIQRRFWCSIFRFLA